MSWLIVRGQPIEAADGSRKTFTLPRTIADPLQVVPFVGNPAQGYTSYVDPPTQEGEYAVSAQVVSLGGVAPEITPYFRYLTIDEPASYGGLLLREPLIGTKDGVNDTFALPQKAASADDVAIFFGTPGGMLIPDATPEPGEYLLAPDLITVTLGLPPESTDALTAEIILPTDAAALPSWTCTNDAFYGGLATTVREIITEFGQQMVLKHSVPGVYTTSSGVVSGTGSQVAFYGIVDEPRKDLVDGTNILRSDKRVIAEDMGTVPDVNDVVTIGGIDHHILQVLGVKPACTPIIYDLTVRAGHVG